MPFLRSIDNGVTEVPIMMLVQVPGLRWPGGISGGGHRRYLMRGFAVLRIQVARPVPLWFSPDIVTILSDLMENAIPLAMMCIIYKR